MSQYALSPDASVHDTYDTSGILDGSSDITINGLSVPAPATEGAPDNPPQSTWTSYLIKPFGYLLGTVGVGVYNGVNPVIETVDGTIDNIHTVLDDPSGYMESYATEFEDVQDDYRHTAESVISGAIPFSDSIGKVFANPLTILVLIVTGLSLWFIGPLLKRVTA